MPDCLQCGWANQLHCVGRTPLQPLLPVRLFDGDWAAFILLIRRQGWVRLVHQGEQWVAVAVGGDKRVARDDLTGRRIGPFAPDACEHPRLAIGPCESPPDVLAGAPVRLVVVVGRDQAALRPRPGPLERRCRGNGLDATVVGADRPTPAASGPLRLAEPRDQSPLPDPHAGWDHERTWLPWADTRGLVPRRPALDVRKAEHVTNHDYIGGAVAVAHAVILAAARWPVPQREVRRLAAHR